MNHDEAVLTVGHSSVLALRGGEGGVGRLGRVQVSTRDQLFILALLRRRAREQSVQTTIERHRHLNPQIVVSIFPREKSSFLLILRLVIISFASRFAAADQGQERQARRLRHDAVAASAAIIIIRCEL